MKRLKIGSIIAALTLISITPVKADQQPPRQLIVVLTDSWKAVNGTMHRFTNRSGQWEQTGKPYRVVVGKHGLAPAREFAENEPSATPKQEGDGKAPAGIFPLRRSMGYSPMAPISSSFPYEPIMEETRCVDDPTSTYYNDILTTSTVEQDWNSAEVMRRKDDLYKWLVVVDYNKAPKLAGAGSCIFIHIWRGTDRGTAGCTALTESDLLELLLWLQPEQQPALVQFPLELYRRLWKKKQWPDPAHMVTPLNVNGNAHKKGVSR